ESTFAAGGCSRGAAVGVEGAAPAAGGSDDLLPAATAIPMASATPEAATRPIPRPLRFRTRVVSFNRGGGGWARTLVEDFRRSGIRIFALASAGRQAAQNRRPSWT